MTTTFNIISQETIYSTLWRRIESGPGIKLCHDLLQGRSKEDTFDAVYKGLGAWNYPWEIQEDIAHSFGDGRQSRDTVYTFNLDNDNLLYSDSTQDICIPFPCLRERFLVLTVSDYCAPYSPPTLTATNFAPPYWNPTFDPSERTSSFVTRLLSDFNHGWRHILRRPYRDITFRKLSKAIIRLATARFTIVEVVGEKQFVKEEPYISHHKLPPWQPCEQHIFDLGQIRVVLDQDLEKVSNSMRKNIRANNAKDLEHESDILSSKHSIYLLLSVRHIMLGHIHGEGVLSFTTPAPLLNGVDEPDPTAITLLLQALSYACLPSPRFFIHEFPLEIQDRVLEHVSDGLIESGRLGYALGIGSAFRWQRQGCGELQVQRDATTRYMSSNVESSLEIESKIHFGDIFSGLSYE